MPARGAVCDGEEQAACALVHDPAHGGISPEEPRLECPEKYREFVFSGRTVITWHRICEFQRLSLKLIAEQMLLASLPVNGMQ